MTSSSICNTCGSTLDPGRTRGRCAACLLADAFSPAREDGTLGEIGGCELLAEIARGGMGVVYRARQREPEREVALKTLRGAELESIEARARFRHEAAAMAELEHPCILAIHQFGEQDGVPFFTMMLATGGSLAERVADFAGAWRATAELLATLAEAVQFAHERGVLHRDLKPANILFDEDGRAFVSDFGLAKIAAAVNSSLTHTRGMLGTPHYVAPEIAAMDSRAATIASDVWSLGVILYELLAQRRAFDGDSVPAVLRGIAEREPPRIDGAPRDLEVIARKAMAKDPVRRYGSASDFAGDLRRWLNGRAIKARPVSRAERFKLWMRRNPVVAALSMALCVALIGGGLWLAHAYRETRRHERTLRENLYAADLSVAQRAAEKNDLGRAAAVLDAWLPRAGAPDLRGFAWRWLRAQVAGDPHRVLRGHEALVSGVALAGPRLYSCAQDGTVRAWNIASGKPDGVWRLDGAVFMTAVALPDGRIVLGSDAGVHRLDPATGTFELLAGGEHFAVVPAPGGEVVLAGTHGWIFSTQDFMDVISLAGGIARKLADSGGRAAFTKDGRTLATGPWGDAIKLWSWPEVAALGELKPSGVVIALAFSPDGRTLAAAQQNGEVVLWDVAERRVAARFGAHAPLAAWSVAFSTDGTRLASSGSDQMVRLWDVDAARLLHTFRGHGSEVWQVAFTADSQEIVSVSKDETVRIWDANPTAQPAPPAGLAQWGRPVFSADSGRIAAPRSDGRIGIFETAAWREIATPGAGVPLSLSDDSLLAVDGAALRRWRVADGALVSEITLEDAGARASRFVLSFDGRFLAALAEGRGIVLWNAATGRIVSREYAHGLHVVFSPRGRWLVAEGKGFDVQLWQVGGDARLEAGPVLRGHKLTVADFAFAPDESLVATASWDDTVRVWSLPGGELRHTFSGHVGGANALAFLREDNGPPTLAALGGYGVVKLWDLRTGRALIDLPWLGGGGDELVASPDGGMLMSIGKDGRLQVWR